MRFEVVSHHVPEREGSAAGRSLLATCEGLIGIGHDVYVRSWRPQPPTADLPTWCDWSPHPPPTDWRQRMADVIRPRRDTRRLATEVADRINGDTIAVADDYYSFAAIDGAARSVLTLHYRTRLDATALARREKRDVQDHRAEGWAARRARLVLAYSDRVGASVPAPATFVPIACPMPDDAPASVDRPVAGVVADWAWPPNRWALDALLRAWPAVRAKVPAARLLLAGRNLDPVGTSPGVEVVGPVGEAAELLARVAVVPFPCPDTSGPKVKVIEALAHGRVVVTTPAGIEGVLVRDSGAALVATIDEFAATLAGALSDPAGLATAGRAGRTTMLTTHAPLPAASARVHAIAARWPDLASVGDRG